jgi:phosphatidylglycerol:prolipoprotein diacylglycerol transferase
MHPILFKIPLPGFGDFPVRSFGVMTMLGVLAGAVWLSRALRRVGVTQPDAVGDLVTLCVLCGFLGARLIYVAVHPEVWHGPVSLIAVWEGGIVSYGGFFGGALGGMWYARRHRIPIPRLGDVVLPALALGQVFGRIGCFLVGDDYGRPWDGPWAVRFPRVEGGLIPEHLVGVPLHPAQLYLSLMNLAIFGAAAWLFARRRFDGQVLAATMALYAVGRFGVEYTRGDDVERGALGALSTAQWWSLGTIVMAGLLYARFRRRGAVQP